MTILEIGDVMRKRRESLHLKQEDLSEMSGVGIKTIHLIEKGEGNPSYETLIKLFTILGMELIAKIKTIN
ncbi:Helix-turn-helix [Chitinophaga sp. YR573]|uniref:helix-turn-helix domain-containing protein n=1 Tax=Chitinophaga sp. YR573 TaxID=1881040 RepID=UPI0008BC30AA|nr:helix-turn-helix domain-containing protein [Chitinophaga sp. YR573]SEV90665.1 Helix-turn-helix [Chitinophaga sp. YR573]